MLFLFVYLFFEEAEDSRIINIETFLFLFLFQIEKKRFILLV